VLSDPSRLVSIDRVNFNSRELCKRERSVTQRSGQCGRESDSRTSAPSSEASGHTPAPRQHRPMRGIQSRAHNPDSDRSDPGLVGLFTLSVERICRSERGRPAMFRSRVGGIQGHSIPLLTGVDDAIDNLLLCRTQLTLAGFGGLQCGQVLPGCWASSLSGSPARACAQRRTRRRRDARRTSPHPTARSPRRCNEDPGDDRLGGVQPA